MERFSKKSGDASPESQRAGWLRRSENLPEEGTSGMSGGFSRSFRRRKTDALISSAPGAK
jgi:hypothetical protein